MTRISVILTIFRYWQKQKTNENEIKSTYLLFFDTIRTKWKVDVVQNLHVYFCPIFWKFCATFVYTNMGK